MKRYKCPKCGANEFYVTAHVTQGWQINETGTFVACSNECMEVIHGPSDDDLWECAVCAHIAPGHDFLQAR